MLYDNKIWVGGTDNKCFIKPSMANRHGFIAGATGTGKSTTIKVLAESFSDLGVPVFLADVKGDMSGLSCAGQSSADMDERIAKFGIDNFAFQSYPTTYYDVFGQMGIPMRTTISELGPILLGRMLGLSDVQRAVLSMVFRIADDQGMLLLNIDDLRLYLTYIGDNAADFKLKYGNISTATIGAIQRNLALLTDEGADAFFNEPVFEITDFMKTENGRGMINVLNATELFNKPLLYSTFMLWLMSELYENLPEVGDLDKPKMVFFFDEAHLLFNDAPAFLVEKIDQIMRLIRSKGVGVYFISQSPSDIPENILGQLQNRIQHALRAYTPAEQKKVKAAAESFRANAGFDTESVLSELAVGEALISLLDEKGAPEVVERAFILPPQSYIGSAGFEKIDELTRANALYAKYKDAYDNPDSAFDRLAARYGGVSSVPAPASVVAPVAAPEAAPAVSPFAEEPVAEAPKTDKERAAEIREQREADRQEDRERRIEEKERREQERQEDRERKEEERIAKQEEKERKEQERLEEKEKREEEKARKEQERLEEKEKREEEKARKEAERKEAKEKADKERAKKNSPLTKIANSAMTSAGRQIGSSLVRGIFGNLLK